MEMLTSSTARKRQCPWTVSTASSKTTVMLQPTPPASTGRNHLYFNPPALPPFPRSPSLCVCRALCLHGKPHTSAAPRYQFIIRLKINLRLLLVSIARSQKNNSYTCSLFVHLTPYGKLLMDGGFHQHCLLTGAHGCAWVQAPAALVLPRINATHLPRPPTVPGISNGKLVIAP